jgi:hypothetical protein
MTKNTESIYARKRSYFGVLYGSVLRSYIYTTIYGLQVRKQETTISLSVNNRISPFNNSNYLEDEFTIFFIERESVRRAHPE